MSRRILAISLCTVCLAVGIWLLIHKHNPSFAFAQYSVPQSIIATGICQLSKDGTEAVFARIMVYDLDGNLLVQTTSGKPSKSGEYQCYAFENRRTLQGGSYFIAVQGQ